MFMIYGGVGTGFYEKIEIILFLLFERKRGQCIFVVLQFWRIWSNCTFKRTKYIYFFPLLSFLEQKCIIQRINVDNNIGLDKIIFFRLSLSAICNYYFLLIYLLLFDIFKRQSAIYIFHFIPCSIIAFWSTCLASPLRKYDFIIILY